MHLSTKPLPPSSSSWYHHHNGQYQSHNGRYQSHNGQYQSSPPQYIHRGEVPQNYMRYESHEQEYYRHFVPPPPPPQQQRQHQQQQWVEPREQHKPQLMRVDSREQLNSQLVPRPIIDPPSWAVPAKGESRLEPVCETASTHSTIDLTTRRYFRVGRSPSSDIPLLHTTSSRRHALIFHHTSGACYITDCHSAHGTYVDGARVLPYPHPPRKVRRGALIRFGGLDAPSFILKSFAVGFDDIVRNLGGVAGAFRKQQQEQPPKHNYNIICESSSMEEDDEYPSQEMVPPTTTVESNYSKQSQQYTCGSMDVTPAFRPKEADALVCIREDGGGLACIADGSDAPIASLVLLNTRINALGPGGLYSAERLAKMARQKFSSLASAYLPTSTSRYSVGDKRSRPDDYYYQEQDYYLMTRPVKKIKSILRLDSSKQQHTRSSPVVHQIPTTQTAAASSASIFRPRIPSHSGRIKRRVKFWDEKHDDFRPPVTQCITLSTDSEGAIEEKKSNTQTAAASSSASIFRPRTPCNTGRILNRRVKFWDEKHEDFRPPITQCITLSTDSEGAVEEKKSSCGPSCKCSFCSLVNASEEEYAKVGK